MFRLAQARHNRWTPLLVSILVSLLTLVPAVATAQPLGNSSPRVLGFLLDAASRNPEQSFRVIVVRASTDTTADSYVAARGDAKLGEVANTGFVAEIKGKDIADIGRFSSVRHITLDAPMQSQGSSTTCSGPLGTCNLANLYPQSVKATSEWGTFPSVNGSGVGVAVVDTGINNLPDFTTSGKNSPSRIVAQAKFSAGTTTTSDGYGHGTHVAGTIAGNSWWNPTDTGKYVGVAPEANLINVKVADDTGLTYESDVINGIQWAIANRVLYNIRVMNLSLQSTVAESYMTDPLDAAVEQAWFNGIFVVVAAGNNGPNTETYSPANDPFVVTVGAADMLNTPSSSDDALAPWSSYGTTQDGLTKPDLVAPGRYITAPLASTTAGLAQEFPNQIVDQSYITLSGTSMAAAVMSGVAALIFQSHPLWTNDQVKWLVTRPSNVQVLGGSHPYPGQGAGEVNVQSDVAYFGIPGSANQGTTINSLLIGPFGATVYLNVTLGTLLGPLSWALSPWSTTTWTTSDWTTSSWSTSSWSTSSQP